MTPKKADLGSKRLISLAPKAWVRWIMQSADLEVAEILSSEFQWLGRDSDVLIKVFSPDLIPSRFFHTINLSLEELHPIKSIK